MLTSARPLVHVNALSSVCVCASVWCGLCMSFLCWCQQPLDSRPDLQAAICGWRGQTVTNLRLPPPLPPSLLYLPPSHILHLCPVISLFFTLPTLLFLFHFLATAVSLPLLSFLPLTLILLFEYLFFLSLPLVLFALSCARLPSCPPLSRPMFCLVIILFLVTPLVFWPLSSLAPCHMLLFVSLIFFLTFSSCRLPLHLYASNFSFFPTSRPWNTLLSSFIILSFFSFYPVKSSSVTRIVHLPAILSTSASSPALSLYICLFFLLRPDAEWNVLY